MPAGERREILAFEQRQDNSNEEGGVSVGEWKEIFRTTARVRYLRGGEQIIGQRLTGVQPVIINVEAFSKTDLVSEGWRIKDTRSDTTYNIRSITPDERGFGYDMLCETGSTDD